MKEIRNSSRGIGNNVIQPPSPLVNSGGRLTDMVTHSGLIKVYLQIFEKQREIIENSFENILTSVCSDRTL